MAARDTLETLKSENQIKLTALQAQKARLEERLSQVNGAITQLMDRQTQIDSDINEVRSR